MEIDGERIQSVPGGSHQGRQLVLRESVQRMQAPCAVAPFYGWLMVVARWLDGAHSAGFVSRVAQAFRK